MSTDDSSSARPAALWKGMPGDQRRQAADAFWNDQDSIVEQAEVMALIARKLNFRFKSVQGLPIARKVAHLMALGNLSDGVAGRLLVAYHLHAKRPMMAAFLDALAIPHQDGLIAQDETPSPAADRLAVAAASLRRDFPEADVDLYFSTLALQDPDTWGALAGVQSKDAGTDSETEKGEQP